MWFFFLELESQFYSWGPALQWQDNFSQPSILSFIQWFSAKIKYLRHHSFQSLVAFQRRAAGRISFLSSVASGSKGEVITIMAVAVDQPSSQSMLVSPCSAWLAWFQHMTHLFEHPDHFCNLCLCTFDIETLDQCGGSFLDSGPEHFSIPH